MMGAVAAAARGGGARTVGVIPQALSDLEVADRGSDELVVTRGMRERKAVDVTRPREEALDAVERGAPAG